MEHVHQVIFLVDVKMWISELRQNYVAANFFYLIFRSAANLSALNQIG